MVKLYPSSYEVKTSKLVY